MIKQVFMFGIVLALAGCAKLAHLDQLLTMKAYSDNKEAQEKFIITQNKNFDKLLEQVRSGDLKRFDTQKKFVKNFGVPVFKRNTDCGFRRSGGGQACEVWMYRYAAEYSHSEKVYLYFNSEGELVNWEHVLPHAQVERNETAAGFVREE